MSQSFSTANWSEQRSSTVETLRPRKFRVRHHAIGFLVAVLDQLIIISASIAAHLAYHLLAYGYSGYPIDALGIGILAAILYGLQASSGRLYQPISIVSRRIEYTQILTRWATTILTLTLLAFLLRLGSSFSRGSILTFAALAVAGLLFNRLVAKRWLRRAFFDGAIQGYRGVVIAVRDEASALDARNLLARFGVTEIGRFVFGSDNINRLSNRQREDKELVLKALEFASENYAEEIVVAIPWGDTRRIHLVREYLKLSPLPAQLIPDRRLREIIESPVLSLRSSLSLDLQRGPLSKREQWLKRSMDIGFASLALMLLLPLLAIVALAIKLDSPGAVIFRQRRKGFNGGTFSIFKFRTMHVLEDGPLEQAKKNDARFTRIGGLLRSSSIDELPQLVNVLIGDMSLVGPRPHALAHDDFYGTAIAEYAFRHHVKPGITGWAQVNGYRGETARLEQMKARVDLDLWYINRWSAWLDLRILFRTCFEVLRGHNAQ